ncbi:MAG: C1 family peptidase [Elusimicrobiales bacterium]
MLKKLIIGLAVCASMSGTAAFSAERTDFDGTGVGGAVDTLQGKLNATKVAQVPAARTFTMAAEPRVYAKGFIKKDLPGKYWSHFKYSDVKIPNALDLRPKLTQVENQGSCGSCWAFSLTATHRDGHALAGTDPGRLSQEWLVDNSTYAAGCQGGYFDSANDFVQPGGQPLWSACPYKSGSGKCVRDLPLAAKIKGWHMLGEPGKGPTVREIEAYMTSTGKSISIGVAGGAGDWQSYSGGVYNACVTAEMDHMVNIVGWDNEGAAFDANGNLPPGQGVWIIRNSWGRYWGDNGYITTKMTDPSGNRCNNAAQEAAYFDF